MKLAASDRSAPGKPRPFTGCESMTASLQKRFELPKNKKHHHCQSSYGRQNVLEASQAAYQDGSQRQPRVLRRGPKCKSLNQLAVPKSVLAAKGIDRHSQSRDKASINWSLQSLLAGGNPPGTHKEKMAKIEANKSLPQALCRRRMVATRKISKTHNQ